MRKCSYNETYIYCNKLKERIVLSNNNKQILRIHTESLKKQQRKKYTKNIVEK